MTLAGSRFLKLAETRYAAIEGECLGVQRALEQTRYFTLGCDPLIIVVDHKSLVGLLNDKSLDDVANTRLFRLKEKTMPWKFTVIYKPGKTNLLADATSRNPCNMEEKGSVVVTNRSGDNTDSVKVEEVHMEDNEDPEKSVVTSVKTTFTKQMPMKAVTWELLKTVTKTDETLQQVMSLVLQGFPNYKFQLPVVLQYYWIKR